MSKLINYRTLIRNKTKRFLKYEKVISSLKGVSESFDDIQRGIDLITVKDLLGHSTVRMTERYTHSSQLSKRKAVEILTQQTAEKVNSPEAVSRMCHVRGLERWRARQDSNLRPSDS